MEWYIICFEIMLERKSGEGIILWGVPYGVLDRNKSSNGVNDLFQEGKPHIESKGFKIISVAPKVGDNSSNVADYNLGSTYAIPDLLAKVIGTNVPFSLPYDKREAKELIVKEKPDFLFLDEITAGFFTHGLISGMPRREDGQPVSVVGARFHAGIYSEFADMLFRALLRMGKELKRPEFTKYGLPNGKLTPGVVNTLLKDLMFRIAVSKATARAFERRFKDNSDYKIIYNGINTEELTPEGSLIDDWKTDGKDIILCAPGRLEKRKGTEYTIEAYAIIRREKPNTKLMVAGDGDERAHLASIVVANELTDDVKFVGRLSRSDYVKALRTADVCICPAVGGEGFGRIIVEPLACGTPVVASNIDGYNETAGGGSHPFAPLCEPQNPEDIARKTLEILDWSPETREKMTWEAAFYVRERFAWPIIAAQIAEVLNDSYNNHGGVDWSKLPRSGTIFTR